MKRHHFTLWSRLLLSFLLLFPQTVTSFAQEETEVLPEEETTETISGQTAPGGEEGITPESAEMPDGSAEIPAEEDLSRPETEETAGLEEPAAEETGEEADPEPVSREEEEIIPEEEAGPEEIYETVDISSLVLQEGGFVSASDDSIAVLFSDDMFDLPDSTVRELEKRILAAAAGRKGTVGVTDLKIPVAAGSAVYYYLINDNPQLFYVDGNNASYYVDHDKKYVTKYLITYDKAYGQKDVDEFNARVEEILSGVSYTWNDEQTALYLHDILVIANTYDETFQRVNAHDALVVGSSASQGYALAYKYLLNRAGIESDVISSEEIYHTWNSVVIGGKTYYTDVTWDDPSGMYRMYCGHRNFLRSREGMTEEEHDSEDWVNTRGESVYDRLAPEEYPDAYWLECETRIPAVRELWAYTANDKNIYVHDYSAGTDRLLTDELQGIWHVPGTSSYYSKSYTSLDVYGDMFLASQEDTVWAVTPAGSVREIGSITAEEKRTGRIYGIQTEGNKVRYDLYVMSERSDIRASGYLPLYEDDIVHVSGITLSSDECRLGTGETVTLTAYVAPEDAADPRVTWESSDPSIAAVDRYGDVKGLRKGTAVITARSVTDPDVYAECSVTVVIRPESLVLSPETLILGEGETFRLDHTVTPAEADIAGAEWSSSDPLTASVDEKGVVTGIREGHAVITLELNGGEISASASVDVIYIPVTGIRILNEDSLLPVGKQMRIRYAVEPANASDQTVTFESDHPEYAAVSEEGIVTGIVEGTAVITVRAGEYSDSLGIEVTHNGIYTNEIQKEWEYTGKAISPAVEVYDSGRLLKAGTDYTVKYKNNIKAGKASIILTMKGNYTGTQTVSFDILPVSLDDQRITADALTLQAAGKTLNPSPAIYFESKGLKKDTDFRITKYTLGDSDWDRQSAGEVTLTVEGIGNFTGSMQVAATVVPKGGPQIPVNKLTVSVKNARYQDLSGDDFETEVRKFLTVKNGKNVLAFGDDYVIREFPVEYKNTGTLKFVIEGTGRYAGRRTAAWKITGISLADKKIKNTNIGTYVYNGRPQQLNEDFSLSFAGVPLEDDEYEILADTYQNNVGAGTASVKVAGRKGFTGTRTVKFIISPDRQTITADDVAVEPSVPFAKGGAKAAVRIFDGELGLLTAGKDYTVKYTANTKAGANGKATVTFKGNFKGTPALTFYFAITPKDIAETAVTVKDVVYSSTAGKYRSAPSLKDTDGKALKAGTDYLKTYVYELKQEDGTYTLLGAKDKVPADSVIRVSAAGTGNYCGIVSGEYRILAKGTDIAKAVFTVRTQEYTGDAVTLDQNAFTKALINKTEPLTYGEDFEITGYSGNVQKGTASVTLHGINGYGGYKTVKFKITGRPVSQHWLDGYGPLTIAGYNNIYDPADVTIEFQKAKLEKGTFQFYGMDLAEYLIEDANIIHVKPGSTVRITDAKSGDSTGVWAVILSEGNYYDSPAGTMIKSGNVSDWPVHVVNDSTVIGMYYLNLKDPAAGTETEYYIVIDS